MAPRPNPKPNALAPGTPPPAKLPKDPAIMENSAMQIPTINPRIASTFKSDLERGSRRDSLYGRHVCLLWQIGGMLAE